VIPGELKVQLPYNEPNPISVNLSSRTRAFLTFSASVAVTKPASRNFLQIWLIADWLRSSSLAIAKALIRVTTRFQQYGTLCLTEGDTSAHNRILVA